MDKILLRKIALKARRNAFESTTDNCGISLLTETVLSFSSIGVISGYMPINTEINPITAMEILAGHEKKICVPVIQANNKPLLFKEWYSNSKMIKGEFGALIPENGLILKPDLLIVPLVAFDRSGARLGYGGGFYDRSLKQLRSLKPIVAVGFAYSIQEVEKILTEKTDQQLDLIVTENEVIDFRQ